MVYARRSWLASEHTLAASVRPVIGVELSTLNPSTGEVRFRLKNLGNGVALGIFYWMDFSEGASSYWTWSKWPFNRENGDLAEQIIETLEVDGSFDYNTRYPIDKQSIAFIFCAFDVAGSAIQTKSWIVDRADGSSYVQSKVHVRTAEQVRRFYDFMTWKHWGLGAILARLWSRANSGGF